MDDADCVVPAGVRVPEPDRRAVPAVLRSQLWHHLLQAGWRRRPAAVAAPVLVLWPPRGLYPDSAGDGDCVGSASDLLAQANLWLCVCGLFRRGDRLPGLHCLGAPYVRHRDGAADQCAVFGWQLPDRRANRREDLQLDRDAMAWQYPAQDAAVLCGWLCGYVHHWWYQRYYAGLPADRC